jgi:hypothetical protein
MTAVGKILVFMNLLLSAAVVAMIALIFTTRTKWQAAYEEMRNVALVAEAAYKSEKLAHENEVKGRDAQTDSLTKDTQALTTANTALKAERDQLKVQTDKQAIENEGFDARNKILTTELDKQKSERDVLIADAQAQRAKVLETQKELADQKLLATNNRIEADTQAQKARYLLDRVEDLEKNLTQATNKLKSLGFALGGSRDSLVNPAPPPAPRDVYGTVSAVSPGGLAVINIGSDSGISAGNKLLVYRVDAQNPKNSLYLGELVVSRTEPKQAVGQFYPKPFARPDERLPKEKDVVATSLGNR